MSPAIVVLMGVAGSGKTSIGTRLAESLGCPFLDGDSLHSVANVEKMSRGIPLNDASRAPWLAAIRARLSEAAERGTSIVVACSALRESYRRFLEDGLPVTWVYLKGTADVIRSRVEQRTNHFMGADMLTSQFEALEEPSNAIVVDITPTPAEIVNQIIARLP